MPDQHIIERYARVIAVALLVAGCLLVLQPFIVGIIFAAIVCVCTWSLYQRVLAKCRNRPTLASLVMTLGLLLVVVVPLAVLAGSLANNVPTLIDAGKQMLSGGPPAPPAWLKTVPMVGEQADAYWHRVVESREELKSLGQRLAEPAKNFLIATVQVFGEGILQLTLVVFVCFFLYRDGEQLAGAVRATADKLAGGMGGRLIAIVNGTVVGVMFGMIGTAAAQALLALIGFLVAGVPAAFLLGAAVFFLSMVPVGPPLIWGGAAAWLYYGGETGWAIFMVLWGALVVSSVDNFLKPILISRGSNMSLALVFLGVLGGVLAFGFIGIFLGPTLLAVGVTLLKQWTQAAPAPGAVPPA
ncbi:MAG: AI-2E family transporter [Burkholderiales bacterium]